MDYDTYRKLFKLNQEKKKWMNVIKQTTRAYIVSIEHGWPVANLEACLENHWLMYYYILDEIASLTN